MHLGYLRKLTANLPDTTKMYFDSEAACFDCHLVKISDASLSDDIDDNDKVLILHYSMKDTPRHFNTEKENFKSKIIKDINEDLNCLTDHELGKVYKFIRTKIIAKL